MSSSSKVLTPQNVNQQGSSFRSASNQDQFGTSNQFYVLSDHEQREKDFINLLNDSAKKIQDKKTSMRDKLLATTVINAITRDHNVMNTDEVISTIEDTVCPMEVEYMDVSFMEVEQDFDDSQMDVSVSVLDVQMEDLSISSSNGCKYGFGANHVVSSSGHNIANTTTQFNCFGNIFGGNTKTD